jgi:hypothetical protein
VKNFRPQGWNGKSALSMFNGLLNFGGLLGTSARTALNGIVNPTMSVGKRTDSVRQ